MTDSSWMPERDPLHFRRSPDELNVRAFYQPILAMDTHRIAGYEALGREQLEGNISSLGPFFMSEEIPEEEKLRIDRIVREQAIAAFAKERRSEMLFLNLKPSWIHRSFNETNNIYTLHLLEKYQIDPKQICIEITEEDFTGSLEELKAVIDVYRAAGCRIAVDDVGSGYSNLDRIALIQPNVIKVDIHMIKKSAHHEGYMGVLRSFSTIAEQIGASLLIEGVETIDDLQRAIQVGSRYMQGFLFSGAMSDFQHEETYTSVLDREVADQLTVQRTAEYLWMGEARQLIELLQLSRMDMHGTSSEEEEIELLLINLLPRLDISYIRAYVCREDGIQTSSSYARDEEGVWFKEEVYPGSDWGWRPYFLPSIVQLGHSEERAVVSRAYSDLDTLTRIRTISVEMKPGIILMADVRDS